MASYTIEIPDGQGARVVAAVCGTYGYTGANPDPQNDGQMLTANEFAEQQIIEWLYAVTEAWEGRQASAAARATAVSAVRAQIDITRTTA